MFDSQRPVCTTAHGATLLLAIAKCACRMNVSFMVLFMGALILIVGHPAGMSVVYLSIQTLIFTFTHSAAATLCVLALSTRRSAASSASGRS